MTKTKSPVNNQIDETVITSIKMLALDMIYEAKSGHPGIVLSGAPIIYTLFSKHLNIKLDEPNWINKDRFILSSGHGSALLYSTLYHAGFKYALEDLQNFRKINSKTPGHPEYGKPGIDMTTGPLGQGFASAVGMAIADQYLGSLFNEKKKGFLANSNTILDKMTYVYCSDGDLMEGISYEAASLAGNLGLGNLVVLYDSNDVTLDGSLNKTFNENISKRFNSMGWEVIKVNDGDNVVAINKAIIKAKANRNSPTLIEIKTILGKGTSLEGTNLVHGKPLSSEDMALLKKKLKYTNPPFNVSQKAMMVLKKQINDRIAIAYKDWTKEYKTFIEKGDPNKKSLFLKFIKQELDIALKDIMWNIYNDNVEAPRETSGKIMQIISDNLPIFIGGSADLLSSTKTYLNKKGDFSKNDRSGRNIWFGVREHAMGAILNGLAIAGLRPFGSTFLSFSDYLKPSLRLSAMMNLPVSYVFTHDSIDVGEDGPTHEPIEQLAMLRSIPNFYVYRPADPREVAGAWETILKLKRPAALIAGRNSVGVQKNTNIKAIQYGGYVVEKEEQTLHATIIASGSDLIKALEVKKLLKQKGIDVRIVSMPCIKLFLIQNKEYQEKTIPKTSPIIAIESSSDPIWYRFAQKPEWVINLNSFGASGKKEDVLKRFGLDSESLANKIIEFFK